jgi:hypothetical protein
MYGGQWLPPDHAQQINQHDQKLYGQQYVERMEQMTPGSSLRGNAAPQGKADRWI